MTLYHDSTTLANELGGAFGGKAGFVKPPKLTIALASFCALGVVLSR